MKETKKAAEILTETEQQVKAETKNDATELVFILDRSGSMGGLESDTIGGFNAFIEKQRKDQGECYVTTVLFDDVSETVHDRISLEEFLTYADVLGAREEDARNRFAHVDTDGDEHISREEFVLSARQYLFGEDIESPGGFVFGVV